MKQFIQKADSSSTFYGVLSIATLSLALITNMLATPSNSKMSYSFFIFTKLLLFLGFMVLNSIAVVKYMQSKEAMKKNAKN